MNWLISGGWWEISKFDDITGPVAVEMGSMRYLEALDNGLCRLGAGHDVGEKICFILAYLMLLSRCC